MDTYSTCNSRTVHQHALTPKYSIPMANTKKKKKKSKRQNSKLYFLLLFTASKLIVCLYIY